MACKFCAKDCDGDHCCTSKEGNISCYCAVDDKNCRCFVRENEDDSRIPCPNWSPGYCKGKEGYISGFCSYSDKDSCRY